MTKDPYRIPCHSLRSILTIKKLEDEELEKHYKAIKKSLKKRKLSITMIAYEAMLAKMLLTDKNLLNTLQEDLQEEDDISEVLEDIYMGITNIYPMFNLELICQDINNEVADPSSEIDFDEILDLVNNKDISSEERIVMHAPARGPKKKSMLEIDNLRKYLTDRVIGQEPAIDTVVNTIQLIASGLYKRATFFFVGPTGTGKTLLSSYLGKKFTGKYKKINCGEYIGSHEYAKLIGSPPGFIGHNEKGKLTKMAETGNDWVILFDEIEKANYKLQDVLLTLLDEGELVDAQDTTLDFKRSIIILSSNVGLDEVFKDSTNFKQIDPLKQWEESLPSLKEKVSQQFRDEFENRIDEWVYFRPLAKEDAIKIANMELKRKLPVKRSKETLKHIISEAFSVKFGARNINRYIKREIGLPVSIAILNNLVPKVGTLYSLKVNKSGKFEVVNTRKYHGLDSCETTEDSGEEGKTPKDGGGATGEGSSSGTGKGSGTCKGRKTTKEAKT